MTDTQPVVESKLGGVPSLKSLEKLGRSRESSRKWRLRNLGYTKAKCQLYKTCFGYNAWWYRESRAYHIAKVVLRQVCRPEIKKMRNVARKYGAESAAAIEGSPEDVVRCEKIYRERLKALRVMFGRNPETGKRLEGKKNGKQRPAASS